MSYTFSSFNWGSVYSIQDPIYMSYLDKEVYFEIYGSLLKELDGRDSDSFIDLFFEISKINSSILVFIDDDAKEDFADLAVDMKLIPDIKELCEGESKEDKLKRTARELGIRSGGPAKKNKKKEKTHTFEEKVERKLVGLKKEITKLREKLNNEPDHGIREEINKKILQLSKIVETRNFTV